MRLGIALTGLGIALLAAGAASAADGWTVEETSRIGFTAYQRGQPVAGEFQDFTAEIAFDLEDLAASRVAVEIATASVTTGHQDRDTTLRSSQFFAAEQWPTARFASEQLAHAGGDAYEAQGTLTIRDVSREVVLPFELTVGEEDGAQVAHAEGEVTISRLEFGVGQGDWASTETVGDEVTIRILIDATRPP